MALEKNRTDPELGLLVRRNLINRGIETPITPIRNDGPQKIERLGKLFGEVLETLGVDTEDDSMRDTPSRIAKMLVNETMWGLETDNFPAITTFDIASTYSQTVQETGITIMSCCEHHWATIDGFATIAYIPRNKVLGLSKLNRIAEYFSRRPQVQERLTLQIAETLKFILGTEEVAVAIDAKHYCVKARGVGDANAITRTTSLHGAFLRDQSTRQEFIAFHSSGGRS